MPANRPAEQQFAELQRKAIEWDQSFQPFHEGSPPKRGYYHVRDADGRHGVAFMHPNRTWTLIDHLKKPLAAWREIR